jgi:hydroxypyruvate reductase
LIARPQQSLEAAAVKCRQAGFSPLILGDLEGESREVAKVHAGIARQWSATASHCRRRA